MTKMKKTLLALAISIAATSSHAKLVPVDTKEATATVVEPYQLTLTVTGEKNIPVGSNMVKMFTIKVQNNGRQEQLVDVDASDDYKEGDSWRLKDPQGNLIRTQTYSTGTFSGMGNPKNNGGHTSSSQATLAAGSTGILTVNGIPAIAGNYLFKVNLSAVEP
ncbi:TPA: hypothetical protein J1299_004285 [Escherichia coli]|nr:hypothetical protein [Escherichia coli]HBA8756600.1 hypothetical protein [Escherichia coli]HBA8761614.1 hypothetical protein [Escherichia coli]HBA9130085.1 hypothetical protein [Escherichia coli]HEF4967613.1 hypothetical protein [Escherichia coli]